MCGWSDCRSGHLESIKQTVSTLQKKRGVGSALPQAEAERPPGARRRRSGVGRRGYSLLLSPPCLHSLVSSSCLYLVLVSVAVVCPPRPAPLLVSSLGQGHLCLFQDVGGSDQGRLIDPPSAGMMTFLDSRGVVLVGFPEFVFSRMHKTATNGLRGRMNLLHCAGDVAVRFFGVAEGVCGQHHGRSG